MASSLENNAHLSRILHFQILSEIFVSLVGRQVQYSRQGIAVGCSSPNTEGPGSSPRLGTMN